MRRPRRKIILEGEGKGKLKVKEHQGEDFPTGGCTIHLQVRRINQELYTALPNIKNVNLKS